MDTLAVFPVDHWYGCFKESEQKTALRKIERGQLLYYPQLSFKLSSAEEGLLTPNILQKGAKNISFDSKTHQLTGIHPSYRSQAVLRALLARFSQTADQFVKSLFPTYRAYLRCGQTSYRPAQIKERHRCVKMIIFYISMPFLLGRVMGKEFCVYSVILIRMTKKECGISANVLYTLRPAT